MRTDDASRLSPPRAATAVLAATVLLFIGCSESFTPASVVEDLRVLAIVAEPPEVRPPAAPGDPTETVVLRAVAVAPPAAPGGPPLGPETASWSFCPFSAGASAGYACAIPACETPLTPAADGSVSVDPIALGAACLGASGGTLPGLPSGSTLPEQVDVLVRYVAKRGGLTREAVQRIPVWTVTPPATVERNANPIFAAAGGFGAGADCSGAPPGCSVGSIQLDVAIDPASFQSYPGGLDRTLQETVAISFFTTAGRFQYATALATASAPSTFTVLDAKELGGATSALVWAVARDGRGGEAVAGPLTVVFSTP